MVLVLLSLQVAPRGRLKALSRDVSLADAVEMDEKYMRWHYVSTFEMPRLNLSTDSKVNREHMLETPASGGKPSCLRRGGRGDNDTFSRACSVSFSTWIVGKEIRGGCPVAGCMVWEPIDFTINFILSSVGGLSGYGFRTASIVVTHLTQGMITAISCFITEVFFASETS